jgi:hypothetical protein
MLKTKSRGDMAELEHAVIDSNLSDEHHVVPSINSSPDAKSLPIVPPAPARNGSTGLVVEFTSRRRPAPRFRPFKRNFRHVPTISLSPNVVSYTKSCKSLPVNKRTLVVLVGHDGGTATMAQTDKVMIVIVTDNIAKESRLHAYERCFYFDAGQRVAAHKTIRQYVRVHHNSYEYHTKAI